MWRIVGSVSVAWMLVELVFSQLPDTTNSLGEGVIAILNYFEMCPDHLDVPSSYDNLTLYMDPDQEAMLIAYGILHMKEEIPMGTYLEIDLRRCMNKNRNSCEKYLIHKIPDVCPMISMKNESWSKFIDGIKDMKQDCPIPPGSYELQGAEMDLSILQNFTDFIGHWQIEMSFMTLEKRFGCLLADMTLSLKRSGRQ